MQKVDVSEARDFQALSHGPLVDGRKQELEYPGKKGVVYVLATDEGVMAAHSSGERDEVVRDAGLDRLNELVRHESVEEVGREPPEVGEVPVSVPTVLLRAEKLDENFGLTARQFVYGVPMRWQVDQAGFVDMVSVLDPDCPNGSERPLE
jgi:hypothetical protein